MKFKYNIITKLPPLAWLAEVTKGKDEVNVVCGNKVECHDSFCVSGIWEGDFSKGEISRSFSLQGTGLQMINEGGICCATPDHVQESLYSIKESDRFIISNSIPFLLAFTGNVLLPSYFDYDKDFNSAFFGCKKCIKQTPLSGAIMHMHRLVNVYVTTDLKISESKREATYPRPTSFQEYRDAMVDVLCKLSENANHPYAKAPL